MLIGISINIRVFVVVVVFISSLDLHKIWLLLLLLCSVFLWFAMNKMLFYSTNVILPTDDISWYEVKDGKMNKKRKQKTKSPANLKMKSSFDIFSIYILSIYTMKILTSNGLTIAENLHSKTTTKGAINGCSWEVVAVKRHMAKNNCSHTRERERES